MNYLPVNYGFVLTGEILFQDSAETIPLDKEIIRDNGLELKYSIFASIPKMQLAGIVIYAPSM